MLLRPKCRRREPAARLARLRPGGGAAGVVAVLLVLLGLYFSGVLRLQQATSTTTTAQVAADNQMLDALTQRVGKIEESIKTLPTRRCQRRRAAGTADSAMKSLGVAVATLNRRSDDIAANASQARERADAAAEGCGRSANVDQSNCA